MNGMRALSIQIFFMECFVFLIFTVVLIRIFLRVPSELTDPISLMAMAIVAMGLANCVRQGLMFWRTRPPSGKSKT